MRLFDMVYFGTIDTEEIATLIKKQQSKFAGIF
jgi:hypothetical protein